MKNTFKILKRNSETCEHDTGVFHSIGLDCDFVESMVREYHVHESDPEHHAIWHDPKIMIKLEGA